MGKVSGLFAGKGGLFVITGILCVIILGGVLLINNISAGDRESRHRDTNNIFLSRYNPDDLFSYKSQYIGDAANIGNLLNELPLGEYRRGIALATDDEPYGLTVSYDLSGAGMNVGQINAAFQNNALIIFALIKNVEHIYFNTAGITGEVNNQLTCQYSRTEVQRYYPRDLWEYSGDINVFSDFLKSLPSEAGNIEQAVSAAIKKQGNAYLEGECITEGHVILDTGERNGTVKVYTIASVGWFGVNHS